MKHNVRPFEKTGLCFICGKPTKLLIHQKCGRKADEAKKAKKIGIGKLNQQQHENGRHRAAKKGYAAGKIPPFCRA